MTDAISPTQQDRGPWFTKNRGFGLFWVITSTIALAAAMILTAEKMAVLADPSYLTSCDINPWVSCGTVMKSWQAELFGFPNQYIGIIGYAMFTAIGMGLVAGARYARWFWWGLMAGATFAFLFCMWLFTQAVWDIEALCLYCMVVWTMAIPQFVYLAARLIVENKTTSPATARLVTEWSWVLVVLIYIGIAAAIFFQFRGMFFPAG